MSETTNRISAWEYHHVRRPQRNHLPRHPEDDAGAHIPPDLLGDVFAAIHAASRRGDRPAGAAQVTRVIEEVAARMPMDAAQGHLAEQIAVFQFLADGMAAQIHAPGLAMLEMYRLTRLADALVQTVSRMERSLKRRQFRVIPGHDVGAVDVRSHKGDAIWCRRR